MENQAVKIDIQEKERPLSSIRIMSLIGLGIGFVSVVVGILVFVFLEGGKYPIISAVGIWYGLIQITFGMLGLLACQSTDEKKQGNLLSGHYVLSIVVMSMGYALAVAIQAVAACGNKNDSCGTNPDTQLALHIVILCVIVVGNFLGITSMVFHMRNRKILHPEWKNRKGCCC